MVSGRKVGGGDDKQRVKAKKGFLSQFDAKNPPAVVDCWLHARLKSREASG